MSARRLALQLLASPLLIAGCGSRPVNPPITAVQPDKGYRFISRQLNLEDSDNLNILTFSGGGTRAARPARFSSTRPISSGC